MKILHLCLACFYIDHYSYQENVLPRYHKMMGHEVMIIASTESYGKDGTKTYVSPGRYKNEDDIPVVRLPYVSYMPAKLARKLRRYVGLKEELEKFGPDFIFLHDIQFLDVDIVREYAKKNKVRMVADGHSDFSNSARGFVSRYILHGLIYRRCAHLIEPYVTTFYGVLPARVDFFIDVYKLPPEKVELLVMGSEDLKAEKAMTPENVAEQRERFGVHPTDFLVVFGGKIDSAKKQVLLLMDAVNHMRDNTVKLILFGSIAPDLKEEISNRLSDRISYIGWANVEQSYDYFSMADVACFPGRHSVYWEQVAGMGIPMIVKRWEGTTHIDLGGNVIFLEKDDETEIRQGISRMRAQYKAFKTAAMDGRMKFMYSTIAAEALRDRRVHAD